MFASGNPNCVSILACGECFNVKCVITCRNYHVSRRLDKVQFILKNRDHSFNNRSLLHILSKGKGGSPIPFPIAMEKCSKRVHMIASPGTFGSHNQPALACAVQRELTM